jgi:molybdopterin converting factor small subunit
MQVKVWLPPLLRGNSDAEEIVGNGNTLHEVLAGLGGAASRVMGATAADGESEMKVYVNGAPTEDWQATLSDGDEVVLVPPIRGGR